MKTIDIILQRIKRDGAVTAKVLADDLGMTTMGIRQHLQSLEDSGLVEFSDIRVKVGRPTRHWSLTTEGHNHFADRHGDLSITLIESVEELFGQEGIEKVVSRREEITLNLYQSEFHDCTGLEEKLNRLVFLREREGYMAELNREGDTYILVENHCPICHAAKRCETLCHSELRLFQRLLENECRVERDEHIIKGQRRCTYRFVPH